MSNTLLISIYSAIKNRRSVWSVWSENAFNAVVMYLSGAFMAVVIIKALEQINIYLFAAVVVFFGIIYLTFRRFVDDLTKTVDTAKQAERERAEQAEEHVNELQHYVAELERSSEALQESHENFRHAAYHDASDRAAQSQLFHRHA